MDAIAIFGADLPIKYLSDLLRTFFGGITAVIAFAVYWEARRIRRIEWFSKTADNWQEFNRLILDAEMAERWHGIIRGNVDWDAVTQKDLMVIYSFLNVLVFEFNASAKGLLTRRYTEKSIGDNVLYFRFIWPELSTHLQSDGWPPEFLKFADKKIRRASSA